MNLNSNLSPSGTMNQFKINLMRNGDDEEEFKGIMPRYNNSTLANKHTVPN
jgi:hypothetical protein